MNTEWCHNLLSRWLHIGWKCFLYIHNNYPTLYTLLLPGVDLDHRSNLMVSAYSLSGRLITWLSHQQVSTKLQLFPAFLVPLLYTWEWRPRVSVETQSLCWTIQCLAVPDTAVAVYYYFFKFHIECGWKMDNIALMPYDSVMVRCEISNKLPIALMRFRKNITIYI